MFCVTVVPQMIQMYVTQTLNGIPVRFLVWHVQIICYKPDWILVPGSETPRQGHKAATVAP